MNKVTKNDTYAIPSIGSILDKIRSAKYISKIDLKQVYSRIPLEESSKQYTASSIPGSGLYKSTRMPFGLTNYPLHFRDISMPSLLILSSIDIDSITRCPKAYLRDFYTSILSLIVTTTNYLQLIFTQEIYIFYF